MRAFALNGVAVVAVLAGGTRVLAVFTKEAFGAELVAPSPIPASVTGDTASLCDLTGLLPLAVTTPMVRRRKQLSSSLLSHFHKMSSKDRVLGFTHDLCLLL